MRYIGDIHGYFDTYQSLIQGARASIQVGDYGAGFAPMPEVGPEHLFIRGNHDDLRLCQTNPRWIPDGTHQGDHFFCGGAWSSDRFQRIPGKEWWPDEELSSKDFYDIMDRYVQAAPRVMVSHDCPESVCAQLFPRKEVMESRTGQAFDGFFALHRPKIWIFGHHHQSVQMEIQGTQFICLGINEVLDL